jgi:hypothetical protein
MSESNSGPDLFNMLADEFAERYRRGERPPLSEYTGKYPALAEQIRELFPALVAIEQFGTGAEQATGSFAVRPGATDPIPSYGRSPAAAWASSTRRCRRAWAGTWR